MADDLTVLELGIWLVLIDDDPRVHYVPFAERASLNTRVPLYFHDRNHALRVWQAETAICGRWGIVSSPNFIDLDPTDDESFCPGCRGHLNQGFAKMPAPLRALLPNGGRTRDE